MGHPTERDWGAVVVQEYLTGQDLQILILGCGERGSWVNSVGIIRTLLECWIPVPHTSWKSNLHIVMILGAL